MPISSAGQRAGKAEVVDGELRQEQQAGKMTAGKGAGDRKRGRDRRLAQNAQVDDRLRDAQLPPDEGTVAAIARTVHN